MIQYLHIQKPWKLPKIITDIENAYNFVKTYLHVVGSTSRKI